MAFNIGAIISVGGEKEYQKAMAQIREEMKYVKAEAAAVTSAYGKNEKSIESLTDANKVLLKAEDVQREALKEAEAALDRMRENGVEPTATAYKRMEANLNNAKAALNETQREILENSAAMNVLRTETTDAAAGIVDFQNKQDKDEIKGYGGALSNIADIFGAKIPSGIADSIDKFGLFDKQVDGTETNAAGGFGSIVSAIGGIDAASIGAIAGVASIGVAVAKMTIDAELEIDGLKAKIQTSLGLTEEEADAASKSIEKIYIGFTENRDEAEQALAAVMRVMQVSGGEAESYAAQVAVIKNAYGKDYSETVLAASTLTKTFGITGQEALDLIATGLQTSADKNGDLLDVLNEYSPVYKRIGDDAETFLSRMVAGADAGAWSVDKAADVYKEIFNKAADGNADFMEAVDSLGLSSKHLVDDLLSGDERAQAAIVTLMDRLDGVRNKTEQNKIASKLLGTQWEDSATTTILAMADVSKAIVDTTGTSTEAMRNMVETTKGWWSRFWKGFKNEIGDAFKGPFWGTADSIIETIDYYKGIPAYANGTSFHPGGYALVGENGPEVLKLPRGSQVIPEIPRMLKLEIPKDLGGDTINIESISINASSVKEFNDVVNMVKGARQNRRAGR